MIQNHFKQTTDKLEKSYYNSLFSQSESNKLKNKQHRIIKKDYFVKDFYYETNWGESSFDRILTLSQIQASKIKFIPIIRLTEAWQNQINNLQTEIDYDLSIETKIIRQDFEDNINNIHKYQVNCNITANPSYTVGANTYYPDYEIKILVFISNDQFYHELKKQKK